MLDPSVTLSCLPHLGHQWPDWTQVKWLGTEAWPVFCPGKAGSSTWPIWDSSMHWTDATFKWLAVCYWNIMWHLVCLTSFYPHPWSPEFTTLQEAFSLHPCFRLCVLGFLRHTYSHLAYQSCSMMKLKIEKHFFEYKKWEKHRFWGRVRSLWQRGTKLSQNKINK